MIKLQLIIIQIFLLQSFTICKDTNNNRTLNERIDKQFTNVWTESKNSKLCVNDFVIVPYSKYPSVKQPTKLNDHFLKIDRPGCLKIDLDQTEDFLLIIYYFCPTTEIKFHINYGAKTIETFFKKNNNWKKDVYFFGGIAEQLELILNITDVPLNAYAAIDFIALKLNYSSVNISNDYKHLKKKLHQSKEELKYGIETYKHTSAVIFNETDTWFKENKSKNPSSDLNSSHLFKLATNYNISEPTTRTSATAKNNSQTIINNKIKEITAKKDKNSSHIKYITSEEEIIINNDTNEQKDKFEYERLKNNVSAQEKENTAKDDRDLKEKKVFEMKLSGEDTTASAKFDKLKTQIDANMYQIKLFDLNSKNERDKATYENHFRSIKKRSNPDDDYMEYEVEEKKDSEETDDESIETLDRNEDVGLKNDYGEDITEKIAPEFVSDPLRMDFSPCRIAATSSFALVNMAIVYMLILVFYLCLVVP